MKKGISDPDPCETLTVKAVAELLHVSQPTVREYIKRSQLPSVTIGRCRRIRRGDLEAFTGARRTYGWRSYDQRRTVSDDDPPESYPDTDEPGGDDIPF